MDSSEENEEASKISTSTTYTAVARNLSVRNPQNESEFRSTQPSEPSPKCFAQQFELLNVNSRASFPEKLMLLLSYVERELLQSGKSEDEACIGWVLGGQAFVVRDPNELVTRILPLAFHKVKFSSFTRKLYRWGFRQVTVSNANGLSDKFADQKVFGHVDFRRDDPSRIKTMQSVTATTTRRAIASLASRQDEAAKRLVQLVHVEPSGLNVSSNATRQQQILFPLPLQMSSNIQQPTTPCAQTLRHRSVRQTFPTAIQILTASLHVANDQQPPRLESNLVSERNESRSMEGLNALLRVAETTMQWHATDREQEGKEIGDSRHA